MQHIIISSISDIQYQQPLIRMATSLANNGFKVTMVGRFFKNSKPLPIYNFKTKRIKVFFIKGKWQYIEYNLRLFFYLLFKPCTILTAVDLDTALAVYVASIIKRKKRVYDAREFFTEMYEIVRRPKIKKFWLRLEKYLIPKFKNGTVVGGFIANEYKGRYGVSYTIIRNIPNLAINAPIPPNPLGTNKPYLLFQGYVNEARGFSSLIPAMQHIDIPLVICGHGNYYNELQLLIKKYNVSHKVICVGMVAPENMLAYTLNATIGILLIEAIGLNQKYSLANKFFDYIHACLPQVSINLPEYSKINSEHNVALLVNKLEIDEISTAIKSLLYNKQLYAHLKANCSKARNVLCWQKEEKFLIAFYKSL